MSTDALTWVDGERSQSLPLPDRGFAFGDGLFETLLVLGQRAVFPDLHRQRLQRGMEHLLLDADISGYDRAVAQAVANAPGGPSALRVTLTRGGGPRGYAPPSYVLPRLVAQLTPLSPQVLTWQAPARLVTSTVAWPTQPQLAGIKHLNRLEQVLAAADYQRQGADEAVMRSQTGAAISVVAGNLFAVYEGGLYTPELTDCGIAGTRRRAIMTRWAVSLGLGVREQTLYPADLEQADELFFCNSLVGIRAVGQFGTRRWSEFPVTRALHSHYLKALTREKSR